MRLVTMKAVFVAVCVLLAVIPQIHSKDSSSQSDEFVAPQQPVVNTQQRRAANPLAYGQWGQLLDGRSIYANRQQTVDSTSDESDQRGQSAVRGLRAPPIARPKAPPPKSDSSEEVETAKIQKGPIPLSENLPFIPKPQNPLAQTAADSVGSQRNSQKNSNRFESSGSSEVPLVRPAPHPLSPNAPPNQLGNGNGQNPFGSNPANSFGQNPLRSNPFSGQNPFGNQNPFDQNSQNPFGFNSFGQNPFGNSGNPFDRRNQFGSNPNDRQNPFPNPFGPYRPNFPNDFPFIHPAPHPPPHPRPPHPHSHSTPTVPTTLAASTESPIGLESTTERPEPLASTTVTVEPLGSTEATAEPTTEPPSPVESTLEPQIPTSATPRSSTGPQSSADPEDQRSSTSAAVTEEPTTVAELRASTAAPAQPQLIRIGAQINTEQTSASSTTRPAANVVPNAQGSVQRNPEAKITVKSTPTAATSLLNDSATEANSTQSSNPAEADSVSSAPKSSTPRPPNRRPHVGSSNPHRARKSDSNVSVPPNFARRQSATGVPVVRPIAVPNDSTRRCGRCRPQSDAPQAAEFTQSHWPATQPNDEIGKIPVESETPTATPRIRTLGVGSVKSVAVPNQRDPADLAEGSGSGEWQTTPPTHHRPNGWPARGFGDWGGPWGFASNADGTQSNINTNGDFFTNSHASTDGTADPTANNSAFFDFFWNWIKSLR